MFISKFTIRLVLIFALASISFGQTNWTFYPVSLQAPTVYLGQPVFGNNIFVQQLNCSLCMILLIKTDYRINSNNNDNSNPFMPSF